MIFYLEGLKLQIQTHLEPVGVEQVSQFSRMSRDTINKSLDKKYEFGFTTNIQQDTLPPGLNEDVIKTISSKKNEPKWLLDWRLNAYNKWLKMKEPNWAKISYPKINYLEISYF